MRTSTEYRQVSREVFKTYQQEHPNFAITFTQWQNVIYTFNYAFRDYLLETGEKGKLPWGIGDFAVLKRMPKRIKTLKDGREVVGLPINWKKSKEHGKKIFFLNSHTEGYKFKWKWFYKTARFKYCDIWNFKPYRITSRLLNHFLKQEGYQHKYREWDLIK
jgi:hypothetical protein